MIKCCKEFMEMQSYEQLDSLLQTDNSPLVFQKEIFCHSRKILAQRSMVKVVDERGKTLFYLKKEPDYLMAANGQKRLFQTNYDGCDLIKEKQFLDMRLIQKTNIFVFYEVEEYTWAITELLRKQFPEKRIIFLDEAARLFWDEVEIYAGIDDVPIRQNGRTMYVLSDGGCYNGAVPDFVTNIYNSIQLMHSLCWARKVSSYGELNEDKTIMLIEFDGGKNGMGDILRRLMPMPVWHRREDGILS